MADALRPPMVRALLWAAGAEFLLVRLFARIGIFIPKQGVVLSAYRALVWTGEVAFNLSLALGVVVLLLTLAGHSGRLRLLVGAAALLALTGGLGWDGGQFLAAGLLLAAVCALAAGAMARVPPGWRAGLGLLLSAQAMRYLTSGLQLGWVVFGLPGTLPGAGLLLQVAELAAACALLAMGLPPLRPTRIPGGGEAPAWRRRLLLASVPAALLLFAFWLNADMTGVFAMYCLGLTLVWPAPLYVAAAGAATLALTGVAGEDRMALGLILLAGLGLHTNQQHLLLLAGWALLALPAAPPEEGSADDPMREGDALRPLHRSRAV